jgi:hypothetical protein
MQRNEIDCVLPDLFDVHDLMIELSMYYTFM